MAHNSVKHWDNYPPQNLRKSTKKPIKIAKKHGSEDSQNPPRILEKCAKNYRKSRFRGVRGALGRGLGAMVVPRGAQEPKNSQKPRSRDTLGPPCGSPFSVLFAIVRCFFVDFFPDIFVMDFLSISDLPGPQKQWFC